MTIAEEISNGDMNAGFMIILIWEKQTVAKKSIA